MKLKKNDERRRKRKRKVNPIILIICEGKETEVDYFNSFNTKYTRVNIRVANKRSKGKNKAKVTDPENLVKQAVHYKKTEFDIIESDGDRVWCIFDTDINFNNNNPVESKVQEIEKTKRIASKNKIKLGISNPCFEVWYLLHFEYTTAFLRDCNDVIKKLSKYIENYKKNKTVYDILKERIAIAINNTEKLKKHHKSQNRKLPTNESDNLNMIVKDFINSNPYTNVSDLILYIEKLNNR